MGSPDKKPGTLAAGVPGVGSPVKKYAARENPTCAVFTMLGEKRTEEGSPTQQRRCRTIQETGFPVDECAKTRESHLAVLAELDVLIGLKALQPYTRCPLVPPTVCRNLVRISCETPRDM